MEKSEISGVTWVWLHQSHCAPALALLDRDTESPNMTQRNVFFFLEINTIVYCFLPKWYGNIMLNTFIRKYVALSA